MNARVNRIVSNPSYLDHAVVGKRLCVMSTVSPCALWRPGDKCHVHGCESDSTIRVSDGNEFGFEYVCSAHAKAEFARAVRSGF